MEKLIYSKRSMGIALGAALLAFTGCAGESSSNPAERITESTSDDRNVDAITTYYEDGSRTVQIRDGLKATINQFCDGNDLVEIYDRALDRSVDHAACEDGKLTPADFVLKQQVNN